MEHEHAFQTIADANDDQYYPGSRAAGTEGYDASVGLPTEPAGPEGTFGSDGGHVHDHVRPGD